MTETITAGLGTPSSVTPEADPKVSTTTHIKISDIRTDGGPQPRVALDHRAIEDYTDSIREGVQFPPIVVFYDGANYWLADGFHRRDATYAAGFDEMECEVHQGTQQDAQWFSFGANKTNGLQRTNDDKQRAVKAALAHPKAADLSNQAIAEHVGVHPDTVSEWRRKMHPEVTNGIRESITRTGRDGWAINVANIGQRKPNSIRALAEEAGVSESMIRRAMKIQKAAPELLTRVVHGNVTLAEAEAIVKEKADPAPNSPTTTIINPGLHIQTPRDSPVSIMEGPPKLSAYERRLLRRVKAVVRGVLSGRRGQQRDAVVAEIKRWVNVL